jgi:predicted MFS family arabinose efflux permease
MASLGVGGVLGALVARPLGRRFGTARTMTFAVPAGLCFALLLPLADKGPRLAFASVALGCIGSVVVIGNAIVDSFMQVYVSPDILGRVISATWAIAFAMMPVGALLANPGHGPGLGPGDRPIATLEPALTSAPAFTCAWFSGQRQPDTLRPA